MRIYDKSLEKSVLGYGLDPDEYLGSARLVIAMLSRADNYEEAWRGTKTRAAYTLTKLGLTSPGKLREYGKAQLMRLPNMGMKTVNWIAEAAFGGTTENHWAGRPVPPVVTNRPKTTAQRLHAAKLRYAELQRRYEKLSVQYQIMERHIIDARDYNIRMQQTVKDVIAAYYLQAEKRMKKEAASE